MAARSRISVRSASRDDEPFVLDTATRLSAFPLPPWRTADEIVGAEARTLAAHLRAPHPGNALLVAADDDDEGRRLGFVFLESVQDYFTGERHGHVSMLAVTEESEGSGVGRALMDASERWAGANGFGRLTLNVFEANRRARLVYEHLGYRPETLRYVKTLPAAGARGRAGTPGIE